MPTPIAASATSAASSADRLAPARARGCARARTGRPSQPRSPAPAPALGIPAVALALALGVGARAAGADELTLLDGRRSEVVSAIESTTRGFEVVTIEGGRLALDTVREVRFPDADAGASFPAPTAVLFLRTGDVIPGRLEDGPEDAVTIASPTLGQVTASLDIVRAVAFTTDPRALRRFKEEHLPKDPDADICVLASWTARAGTVETIGARGLRAELAGGDGAIALAPDQLVGVRLAALADLPPRTGTRVRLELSCGAIVDGSLSYLRGGFVGLDTAFAKAARVEQRFVVALAPLGGRFTYLSDLAPVEVEERSEVIGVVFPHRRDEGVAGGPLRLGGVSYRKGIGVKAHTRLVYDLGGGAKALRAVIGLDDSARQNPDVEGSVLFQVLADGRPLLGDGGALMTSRDAPRALDLPLAGVERLELIATFGPSGDILARGAWADAFLVK